MSSQVIIADSSCLIALQNAKELNLLREMYEEITITPEVKFELGDELPDWLKVKEVQDKQKIELLELELDKGESSAIALALEMKNSLLIIDERKGRGIARRMGLKYIGLLGVIRI